MPDRGTLFIYVRYIRANLTSFTLSLKTRGIISYLLNKLQQIANEEDRQVDEIVREAIAEWVRGRITETQNHKPTVGAT